MIKSASNDKIKLYRKLSASKQARKKTGLIALEGFRLIKDSISFCVPKYLFVTSEFYDRHSKEVDKLSSKFEQVLMLDKKLINKISEVAMPQEIMAIVGAKPKEVESFKIDKTGRYIALNGVKDPGNVGTIVRTAAAFGFNGVIIDNCCDPLSPKSVRASMSAVFKIPLYKCDNLSAFLESKCSEISTYAAVVEDADCDITSNIDGFGHGILIVGGEAFGIDSSVIKKSSLKIRIPINTRVESLNVAAAAAICMYEMQRGNLN